jgi:hypothetical protein
MSIWWRLLCSVVMTQGTPTIFFPLEPLCRGRWQPARGSWVCSRKRQRPSWFICARGITADRRPMSAMPQPPITDNREYAGLVAKCRLCCKSRKLQGSDFFAKTRNGKQSTIRIISIALPKSPVSFARGDEVPHIFTRKPRLQPAEFLITGAKRLFQQNLP